MSEGTGSNGADVVELHPEAVEAHRRSVASKLEHHDREIVSADAKLDALYRGETPWQRDMLLIQKTMANQLAALTADRYVHLAASVAAIVFLGVFCAGLVWLYAHR